ncbi:MAG: hypothetical protein K0R17_2474 [Rariglobus sp.]|nr:hypothetical protein [Rariglobus sp.]
MADEPLMLGAVPLLVVDDGGLVSATGVRRTFHPARTLAKPVMEADRPVEGGRVYIYGSVIFDPKQKRLRMWYGTPKPSKVLYATSSDGLEWTKPAVGLFSDDNSFRNNIVHHGHSPSVLRDEFEMDPEKRYKMLRAGGDGAGYVAYSADGIRWTDYSSEPVFTCPGGDTMTLAQNPRTGEYLAYHKNLTEIRGIKRRTVWLTRSRDLMHWDVPQLVFVPDEKDEDWTTPNSKQRADVYVMSVFPHASGFVGMPSIFRIETTRPPGELTPGQAGDDGPIDIQLVTSADGVSWARTEPRVNMIPRGAHGDFDRGALLGVSNTPVNVGDRTWVYYTALTTSHGAPIPLKRISIGRAEWRLHGFASLDAEGAGEVETKPVRFLHRRLVINTDASEGEVRVELRDLSGKTLPGYSFADSKPVSIDATRCVVRWKTDDIPIGQPLTIAVKMRSARLFSLWSAEE